MLEMPPVTMRDCQLSSSFDRGFTLVSEYVLRFCLQSAKNASVDRSLFYLTGHFERPHFHAYSSLHYMYIVVLSKCIKFISRLYLFPSKYKTSHEKNPHYFLNLIMAPFALHDYRYQAFQAFGHKSNLLSILKLPGGQRLFVTVRTAPRNYIQLAMSSTPWGNWNWIWFA